MDGEKGGLAVYDKSDLLNPLPAGPHAGTLVSGRAWYGGMTRAQSFGGPGAPGTIGA